MYFDGKRGKGSLVENSNAHNFNPPTVLRSNGVLIAQVGSLAATLYNGEFFHDASCPITVDHERDLPALWAYCSSHEYARDVRERNASMVVRPGYLTKVPFDVERWRSVAAEEFPDGLPEPFSDDATQWLFKGCPRGCSAAVAGCCGPSAGVLSGQIRNRTPSMLLPMRTGLCVCRLCPVSSLRRSGCGLCCRPPTGASGRIPVGRAAGRCRREAGRPGRVVGGFVLQGPLQGFLESSVYLACLDGRRTGSRRW